MITPFRLSHYDDPLAIDAIDDFDSICIIYNFFAISFPIRKKFTNFAANLQ